MALQHISCDRFQIYVASGTYLGSITLYEAIFMEARRLGIAGATVTRCNLGYGPENRIRGKATLVPANEVPVKIEIIDKPEKLELLLPFLEKNLIKGILVRDKVDLWAPIEMTPEGES